MNPAAIQHLRGAATALAARDFARARTEARAAQAIAPQLPDAANLLGLAEFESGDFAAAEAAFREAIRVNPRYANAWQNLAAMLERAGRAAESAEAAHQSLVLSRNVPYEQWMAVGARAHRAGKLTIARDCFEHARALRPRDVTALNNLAVVRDAEQLPTEARALARELLALAPDSPLARHTFAAICSKSTEHDDLAAALVQSMGLLAEDPRHAGAHECAAAVLAKNGDADGAIRHARAAVEIDPGEARFRIALVRYLEGVGRLDDALAELDALPASMRDDPQLLRFRGTVHLRRGELDLADAALARAADLAHDDQMALAQRILVAQRKGEVERGAELAGLDRFLVALKLRVPDGFADLASFNRALAHDIRHHSRLRFEPVGLAAKNGYLTEDLFADRTPAIIGFEQSLREAIDTFISSLPDDDTHPFVVRRPRAFRLTSWATRVAAQGVIDTHIHDESWLSGAYYVELPPGMGGDEDHAGWIEFGRPHKSLPAAPDESLRCVEPVEGTLLLFPSYVFHRTLPFEGEGERISISFDLSEAR